jgi:hypothetical protein
LLAVAEEAWEKDAHDVVDGARSQQRGAIG